MASEGAPTHSRLFFALWPDDAARARLATLVEEFHGLYGGRRVATSSLHMTLTFLGDTPNSQIPALEALAREVDAAVFDLVLTVASAWNRGVFWLAPQEVPPQLADLAGQLQAKLRAADVAFDDRPFVAHLTLMRNARYPGGMLSIEPVELKVADFVLVRTVFAANGAQHEVIGRFPLRSPLGA
jgi:2'-5' RNA ligase